MAAYYNEIDAYAAAWLQNLIDAGHLPGGDIDTRSIADVQPVDLIGYAQCHFFAGIGGWAYAARLAGWPDDREIWTGSCPCQPFSVAGKQRGTDDERHLWPHYFRLIRAQRPAVVMGEQVAAAARHGWLDGVFADLEGIGYACGASVVPACAVNASHRRDRLWFVADAARELLDGRGDTRAPRWNEPADRSHVANAGTQRSAAGIPGSLAGQEGIARIADNGGGESDVAKSDSERGQVDTNAGWRPQGSGTREVAGLVRASNGDVADADQPCASAERSERSREQCGTGGNPWARHSWIIGHDGKARRVEPSIRLLAHGVSARVGRLRAYGNAIVPQVAAEVIGAYMERAP